jgi:hypothetical protein
MITFTTLQTLAITTNWTGWIRLFIDRHNASIQPTL